MSWNYQSLKFKIVNYEIENFSTRFDLIKKVIGIWIIITVIVALTYHEYIYNFEAMNEYFSKDLSVKLILSLPNFIKSILLNNPIFLSFSVIALAFIQIFKKNNQVIPTLVLCILFNFYYCLTFEIGSGATTIVCNLLSYIFLIDLFLYLENKLKDIKVVKNWLFFSMKLQICIVYIISGLVKASSKLWLNGAATYYIFHNKRYFKLLLLLPFLDNSEYVLKLSSILPIVFLLLFPILAWTRKSWVIVIISVLFHGFIAIGMGLKEFMIFPILDYLLFCNLGHVIAIQEKLSKLLKMPKKGFMEINQK